MGVPDTVGQTGLWFYPTVEDLEPDAEFEMIGKGDDGSRTKPCWGRVLEMHPHSHLRYVFSAVPLQGAKTEVDWRLEETDGGTTIHLEHSGFETAGDAAHSLTEAFDAGWDRHIGLLTSTL